jgi:EpsI family protein
MLAAGLLLFSTGIANVLVPYTFRHTRTPIRTPQIPFVKEGWRAIPSAVILPEADGTQMIASRAYRFHSGPPLQFIILHNKHYTYGVDSHLPTICYRGAGWQLAENIRLSTSSGRIQMAGFKGTSQGSRLLVYYGFHVGERILPDGISRKFYEIKDRFRYGAPVHFLVEAAILYKPGQQDASARYVRKFFDDMEPSLLQPGPRVLQPG